MLASPIVVGAFVQVCKEDGLEARTLDGAVGVEFNVQLVRVRGDGSCEGIAAECADFLLVVLRPGVDIDEVIVAGFLSKA